MKAIVTIILIALAFAVGRHSNPQPVVKLVPYTPERQATFDDLLDAIEQVESGGDANAVGDDGWAVGAYQIHKIYVRDTNRILGYDKFTYEDRWDRDKSREMTSIVIQHYGKGDIETMARTHKCPTERYKDSTLPYWEKVNAVLYD